MIGGDVCLADDDLDDGFTFVPELCFQHLWTESNNLPKFVVDSRFGTRRGCIGVSTPGRFGFGFERDTGGERY